MPFFAKNTLYLIGFYLFWLLIYAALGFETTLISLAIMANLILIGRNQVVEEEVFFIDEEIDEDY